MVWESPTERCPPTVLFFSSVLLALLLTVSLSPLAGALDMIPPTGLSNDPANGATRVSRNFERVSIVFSESVRIGSQAITGNWTAWTLCISINVG
jgi:hypothetical protein